MGGGSTKQKTVTQPIVVPTPLSPPRRGSDSEARPHLIPHPGRTQSLPGGLPEISISPSPPSSTAVLEPQRSHTGNIQLPTSLCLQSARLTELVQRRLTPRGGEFEEHRAAPNVSPPSQNHFVAPFANDTESKKDEEGGAKDEFDTSFSFVPESLPAWCQWAPSCSSFLVAMAPIPAECTVTLWEVRGAVRCGITEPRASNQQWLVTSRQSTLHFLLERDVGILRLSYDGDNPCDIVYSNLPLSPEHELFICAERSPAQTQALTVPFIRCVPNPQRSMSPKSLLMQSLAGMNRDLTSQLSFTTQKLERLKRASRPEEIYLKTMLEQLKKQLAIHQREGEVLRAQCQHQTKDHIEELNLTLQQRDRELVELRLANKTLLSVQKVNNRTIDNRTIRSHRVVEGQRDVVEVQAEELDRLRKQLQRTEDEAVYHHSVLEHCQTSIEALSPSLSLESYRQAKEAERLRKKLDECASEEGLMRRELHGLMKALSHREGWEGGHCVRRSSDIEDLKAQIGKTRKELERCCAIIGSNRTGIPQNIIQQYSPQPMVPLGDAITPERATSSVTSSLKYEYK